jgi:hypothetical protein
MYVPFRASFGHVLLDIVSPNCSQNVWLGDEGSKARSKGSTLCIVALQCPHSLNGTIENVTPPIVCYFFTCHASRRPKGFVDLYSALRANNAKLFVRFCL